MPRKSQDSQANKKSTIMHPSDFGPLLPQKHIVEHMIIETQITPELPHLHLSAITKRPNGPHITTSTDLNPTSPEQTIGAITSASIARNNAATETPTLNRLFGGCPFIVHPNKGLNPGTGRYFFIVLLASSLLISLMALHI